ncbi:MAG: hypothetical protein HY875_11205 [Chloroflexi bacterium]|nr:hypothetical protein [Chloroflexota bacterium]
MSPKRFLIALAAAALAVAGTLVGLWVGGDRDATEPGGSADDGAGRDLVSLDEILGASQAVVLVELVSERDDTIVTGSATPGGARAEVVEHVQVVRVREVLRGTVAPETLLSVYQSARTSREGRRSSSADYETIPLKPGDQYVLFLVPIPRPPVYPGTDAVIWIRPGEPAVAKVHGDRLEFLATARYQAAVAAQGLKAAQGQKGVPFTVTLSELRGLAATGQ